MRGVHCSTNVGNVARVDYKYLAALSPRHGLERTLERIDRTHRRLSAERLAELEEEIVVRCEGGDIGCGLVGR
jgi:hypothetical protein